MKPFIFLPLVLLVASFPDFLNLTGPSSSISNLKPETSAFQNSEEAYRANNIGVALLEEYKSKDATDMFRRALQLKPDLVIARVNLGIALFYTADMKAAERELRKALTQDSNLPQAHYLLGLIARSDNRFEDSLAEFERVRLTDPNDVGANINVGQILLQQKKYPEALAAFRKAVESEPYNETALYNLGILLTRTGSKAEGQRLLQKFQRLKETGAGTSLGTNYLEGGHYAEAIVSTGAESELVDRATPDVRFVDVSNRSIPADKSGPAGVWDQSLARAAPIVLFDFDGDGDLDIFDGSGSNRLLRNDGGKFTDVTESSGLSVNEGRSAIAAVAGDYDNDGREDLFVLREGSKRLQLYHNDGDGHFSDRSSAAGLSFSNNDRRFLSAAFVDVDHDGDLDLFISGSTNLLLRNNGNGTFADITDAARVNVKASLSSSAAVIPTDFDNRRDIDLFVMRGGEPPSLFQNMRDQTFREVAREVGLQVKGTFSCAAAGDLNKDGFTDFFLGGTTVGQFALSNGRGSFHFTPAPADSKNALAAQFLDYDNDGLLDLIVLTTRGLRLWRNVGKGFVDVSARALPESSSRLGMNTDLGANARGQIAIASGDLDGDGAVDLLIRGPLGQIQLLRNEGGNQNHSLAVMLKGRVSNKSAIEAKVEIRAGSLYQKLETYSAYPAPAPVDLIFGLGKRTQADAVRVLWPAGIVQAETELPTSRGKNISVSITELDRKPSSCPYLYTWNGERFEFITDFMGGGEMGYLEDPGHYNQPDPDEYVRIRGDQLKEKDGRYEIRITNELEESMFVDRLQLLAVSHPADIEVYPNEGMSDPPKPFKLFLTKDERPPLSAVDDQGHDVLDLISRMDRRWPENFSKDRIRGYAEEHSLTLRLADDPSNTVKVSSSNPDPSKRMVLLLTGWTDYAWSSDNVAAFQSGKVMKPPALQVKDKTGNWRTVIEDIGIPVGRPQTVTVDLTGKFLSENREVRIVTNMRVYWDLILFGFSSSETNAQVTRLDPSRTDLHWRGFSAEVSPDGREPFGYDYQKVTFSSPWKVMSGHYTREGDVRELLLKSDDMFAICRPGDELSVSFDARALPSLPVGWQRTFLLYADGFSKEMDINSASPDQLAPLPFHGMSRYPYKWPEHYPLTEARKKYLEKYNTRVVTANVPSIVTVLTKQ